MIISNLLLNFLKEEVRIHTNLYKKKSFFSYPFTIFIFFFLMTTGGIFLFDGYNPKHTGSFLINIFFIAGIMSGAFGLYAQDYLERKFGDFGKLFSNTQILPIKLNITFLTLSISDSIFYLFWFIIPTIAGFVSANWVMGYGLANFSSLLLNAFIVFTLGLFTTFLISVIYQKSKVFFYLIFLFLISFGFYLYINGFNLLMILSLFYLENNLLVLVMSLTLIFVFAMLSFMIIGNNFSTKKKQKKKEQKSLNFSSLPVNHYVFKDYIDLIRTGGMIGKPLFTVFIPAILLLILFSSIEILKTLNIDVLFFAIIIGTLSTQLLNSLINSDDFRYYRYLPVSLKNYIISKMQLSFVICFVMGIIILLFYSLNILLILKASIILIMLIFYNFCVSFYLTGLQPNENLMQSKNFIEYFIFYVPVLFAIIIINIFLDSLFSYIVSLVIILLLSKILLRFGIRKWNKSLF